MREKEKRGRGNVFERKRMDQALKVTSQEEKAVESRKVKIR